MYAKPTAPEGPDHYGTLELEPDATDLMVQKAYRRLALIHHPDKQELAHAKDDSKFKKASATFSILAAYETRSNPDEKEEWEYQYPNVHEQWKKYRRDLADWERRTEAEEEAAAARARSRTASEAQERHRIIWLMGERERSRRIAQVEEAAIHESYWSLTISPNCICKACRKCRKREVYERRNHVPSPTPDEYAEYLQIN
ncbi:hypothetical protein EK21DRAFT_108343 [Setomelanomma holmii]|uniref:J domain-containing protein n=1 Tax=Setomelanomma holmii TaxID=210430 RepID=A0A9P4HFF9_9PLEO|nr:hypothetical protein EK21DRAFT_108343 [Setomelanomma holmii]